MVDKVEAPIIDELSSTRDGRDITRGYVDGMTALMPQDEILQLRGSGSHEMYRKVLQDPQVAAVFQQRRLAVVAREWEVEPGGSGAKDKAAADFIRELLETRNFDALTDKMLSGLFYGYSVAECLWGRDGRHIIAEQIRVRDRARFCFDGLGRLRLRTLSHPSPGELMPERKFWVYQTGADHDDEPYGLGLAHWLYWPVLLKRSGWRYWATFLDKFGRPTVLGTYPPGAGDTQKRELLAMTQAVYSDSGVILPQGMALQLLEASRSGAADYDAFCHVMDQAIAKVVLGQTQTSEAAGGQYKSDVQNEVRLELVKADADIINHSFEQQVVRWLIEWNYPTARVPTVRRILEEAEDLNDLAQRTERLGAAGFRPTLRQVQETFGGEWVDQGGSAPTGQPKTPAAFAEGADGIEPYEAQAQVLADAAAPAMQAMIEQARRLLDESSTLAEFGERLAELWADMSAEEFAATMGQAMTAAHLAGRYDILDEAR